MSSSESSLSSKIMSMIKPSSSVPAITEKGETKSAFQPPNSKQLPSMVTASTQGSDESEDVSQIYNFNIEDELEDIMAKLNTSASNQGTLYVMQQDLKEAVARNASADEIRVIQSQLIEAKAAAAATRDEAVKFFTESKQADEKMLGGQEEIKGKIDTVQSAVEEGFTASKEQMEEMIALQKESIQLQKGHYSTLLNAIETRSEQIKFVVESKLEQVVLENQEKDSRDVQSDKFQQKLMADLLTVVRQVLEDGEVRHEEVVDALTNMSAKQKHPMSKFATKIISSMK